MCAARRGKKLSSNDNFPRVAGHATRKQNVLLRRRTVIFICSDRYSSIGKTNRFNYCKSLINDD